MLGKCEKMPVISSTTNQWSQQGHNQIDEKSLMSSTARLMEKPCQQEQAALKCPRCDSSNTKFCYYNNYSLSQPRHFCKACKRYWTRGGTLRNVPVGGGCRKNKRVKRSPAVDAPSSTCANPNKPIHTQIIINNSSVSSTPINPLFYGLPTDPSDHINLPFPRSVSTTSGYGLQSQLDALGLGTMNIMSHDAAASDHNPLIINPTRQLQDMGVTSTSLLSTYPIFANSPSSTPTMASFLASTLHQQQKLMNGTQPPNHFQSLASFQDLQMGGGNSTELTGAKAENGQGQSKMEWNHMDQVGLSDPNSLYWNTTGVGAWHDPANIGSSVTSLI